MSAKKAKITDNKTSSEKPKSRGEAKDIITRKLHILQCLRSGPKAIGEIEAYLKTKEVPEVSRRMLQRNLNALNNHFGVYRTNEDAGPGLASEWAIDSDMFDNPFAYNPDVAMALALSYQQIKALVPIDITEKVEPVFKQAISQLEKSDSIQAKWAQRVSISHSSYVLPPATVDRAIAKQLTEYALNQVAVQIRYRITHSADDIDIEGTALGINYRGNVAYLILRPRGKSYTRQFPFSRIYAAKELITSSPEVGDFDIAKYAADGRLSMTFGDPFRLEAIVFESVRREIEDAPLGADQSLTAYGSDEMYRHMAVTVPYNLDLVQWLIARAPYLKVTGPAHFKAKFEEELRRAWANVNNPAPKVPSERNFGA